MCMIVSVCLRRSKRTRRREWVMRDGTERGDTERESERERGLRERCCGSSSISSLLSGPWATQLSESAAALPSPKRRIRYARHRRICFNSPLTPPAPRRSKSGLNKPQGCAPDKQTNMQRRPLCIRRALCLPREADEPTLSSSLHDTGKDSGREGGGRQEKEM